jgi:hypothetical protein
VYKRPDTFIKDRKLLQWIGTEWGRSTISDTLWVELWKEKVLNYSEQTDTSLSKLIVACDDARFDNEAEVITSMEDGIIIKLVSKHTEDRIDTKAGIASHGSEAGVDKKYIYCQIENNGTKEEFKESLRELFKHIGVVPHDAK